MITTKIVFNGRQFGSVEEMPADVRRLYEQALAAQGGRPEQLSGRAAALPLAAGPRWFHPGPHSLDADPGPIPAGNGLSASGILLRFAAAAALALAPWWLLKAL